jgi:hypothetical protein
MSIWLEIAQYVDMMVLAPPARKMAPGVAPSVYVSKDRSLRSVTVRVMTAEALVVTARSAAEARERKVFFMCQFSLQIDG